jgi:hypothetical protein
VTDQRLLLCTPVKTAPVAPLPSEKGWCEVCAAEVWVSRPMWPLVQVGEFRVFCLPCGRARADMVDASFEIDPRQRAQLASLGALPAAERFVVRENRRRKSNRR